MGIGSRASCINFERAPARYRPVPAANWRAECYSHRPLSRRVLLVGLASRRRMWTAVVRAHTFRGSARYAKPESSRGLCRICRSAERNGMPGRRVLHSIHVGIIARAKSGSTETRSTRSTAMFRNVYSARPLLDVDSLLLINNSERIESTVPGVGLCTRREKDVQPESFS
jgi:hypothetical protein